MTSDQKQTQNAPKETENDQKGQKVMKEMKMYHRHKNRHKMFPKWQKNNYKKYTQRDFKKQPDNDHRLRDDLTCSNFVFLSV